MRRNMSKWIDDLLIATSKKGFLILSFPAIQKMDITVNDLIASSKYQSEAMKIVADLTPDALAAVSMMDLSIEAEAFGAEVLYFYNEVPTVVGKIVKSRKDAEELQIPQVGAGRTGISIEAVKKAVQVIQDRPIFASVIGPFSLAGRLLDVTEAMYHCYDKPDMVHQVLEKVTSFLIQYIQAYKDAGAHGVFLAEPLGGILSPSHAREFSSEYIKKIVSATQTEDFLIAYHNCGNGTVQQIESIREMGCRILHFGNAIDIVEMMPNIPSDVICMGNLDPAGVFRNGDPKQVKAATIALLQACTAYPNFVVSSGCDIPPLSPWENIDAFFDGVKDFYAL